MTKELMNVVKEYSVNFELNGAKIEATVEATENDYDNYEVDVRIISLDSDSDSDIDEDEAETYIIDNWDEFEEVEGGSGG